MGIGGVSKAVYPNWYETKKVQSGSSANQMNSGYPNRINTPAGSGSTEITLHAFDGEEGDTAIGSWANVQTGSSTSVYKTKDFDPENPVYKVKIWDKAGNVTEKMVDISEINTKDCSTIDMYAYSAHLESSGQYPDAINNFTMSYFNHINSNSEFGFDNLFDKVNWQQIVKEMMEVQYEAGNHQGYLDFKKFMEFL